MNCANHPETTATAFCRECGKPLCQECQRPALGSIYCAEHVPASATASFMPPQPPPMPEPPRATPPPPPYTPPASSYAAAGYTPGPNPYTAPVAPEVESTGHPVLAFILGFIPGVGAIYNGQYAKGLIHVVVFGLLVSLVSRNNGPFEPLFGIMIAAWVFYMAFEAYHTARKKRYGVAVEEFSSLFDVRPVHGRFPAGAIVLIALGFILLLDTTDIISWDQLQRYWPIGLIIFGLYMLYARLSPAQRERHAEQKAEAQK